MTRSLLSRLDARDRALFERWALAAGLPLGTRRLWVLVTHLGGVRGSIAAATLPLLFDGAPDDAGRLAITVLVLSHLLVQMVKRTVGRPRPSRRVGHRALLTEPDRFSFPSGHAAAAMSVAFGWAVVVPELGGVLIPSAVLVGASRVMLGVHYPGDVLVGQLLALGTGLVVITIR
jgi:undecaprenyl-diphosphatase